MKESTTTIAVINESLITVSNDENKLVAIRPICQALGIAHQSQIEKIKEDPILGSVVTLNMTTGVDGKTYEMSCLPLKYIFGWLFTINPKNVSPEAAEIVQKYKSICYDALFEYFTEPQSFLKMKQTAIEEKVNILAQKQQRFTEAKKEMAEAKTELNKVMSISIEEWRFNNRQLNIDFKE